MTTIHLAWTAADRTLRALAPGSLPAGSPTPSLLISFAWWKRCRPYLDAVTIRSYMTDSGAFTVHSGAKAAQPVTVDTYGDFLLERMADPLYGGEAITLDSLSDWRIGQRNTYALWARNIPVMPVYHYGEPEPLLREYASAAPKLCIGFGGKCRGELAKLRWCERVFAAIWPKKIHGLAMTKRLLLDRLPFHSVDSSSWDSGPGAWGIYRSIPARPSKAPRGKDVDLRGEVLNYLQWERDLAGKWRRELARLDAAPPTPSEVPA